MNTAFMEKDSLKELLKRYREDTCSMEEKAIVENWYLHYAGKQKDELPEEDYETVEAEIWNRIKKKNRQPSSFTSWYKMAAAAVIVFVLGFAAYQYNNKGNSLQQLVAIKAGGIKAELIMANGEKMPLSVFQNGKPVKYPATNNAAGSNDGYNTIATPKGGQYHFVLPDGSEVWLNAYSSLSYPKQFTGTERKVILKGEAYFEVAHNKLKPFRVHTASQEVEVLGTRFNLSSYDDDKTSKVTLLEGRIKVLEKNTHNSKLLRPGQELEVSANNLVIKEVNTEEAIDWKMGYFKFQNENIKSIMLKVGRWYDIDIVYEGNIPVQGIEGTISRTKDLSKILEMLQATGLVKFRIEERKVIVSPATP